MGSMHLKMISILFSITHLASTMCEASMKRDELIEYERYVNEIVSEFASETEKRCHVLCVGEGGRMPHDVEEIEVKFWTDRKGTIEEARRFIVTSKRALLDKINANEKIRPFLIEYPFTAPRACISISFADPKTRANYGEETVAFAFDARGLIVYAKDEPPKDWFVHMLEEPYEEAERIVAEEEAQGALQFGPLTHRRSRSFLSRMFPKKQNRF